ncbi:hypothetical protein A3D42_01200 [Candidatus Nomurabacteria bacterium RIFCSPHIGHO2_02_FULL_41_18]|uniref:Ada DNA repair metal-binding domain-containing protein n=1 Tax=Candidatus Nomurabacteria bacterium RIFCSPHIGHO2_02_FULL_41_18 TaxID=1801754 RepID=A0A1F6W755_9BACT|nr:MAG: hypothetical protein A2737_03405 [Candidatus Nomurabacteria bacterium RIFCSPHIGHO2_01_FULL_41_71]OGI77596.1 MAG: hypothetical protein A3D42_01200 [Candidatus Nomurabacteria bacterium RIFCSPHIGHO2_02_FULL_41_18]OGI89096.1 MAG: hypothetical protein A3B01_00780 [Candidatus Nomurabacteria bacterium RIFCSPLOWO2_01_FULL_41_52b]OGJ00390.1 MAG: hypothetical protein A3I90_00635 [Candidatus Nomurabacteria bacterium RIFCSPLOWO2_02_FULL_41_9]
MEKIKQFLDSPVSKDILTVIIVILVGLISFGLGRLSKQPKNEGLKIEYKGETADITANVSRPVLDTGKIATRAFFASNKGSKYYPVGCSAGKNLKEENRIYFNTRESAEIAGYELSTSCR